MKCQQRYNGAWITDRVPTDFEANDNGYVWITLNGQTVKRLIEYVELGTPWQPCYRPAPYLNPQRYTVGWNSNLHVWNMYENGRPIGVLPRGLPYEAAELAQQIAKFYNEVNQ
jgi:hypothetical protein